MKAVLVINMPDDVSLDEWYAVKIVVDRLKATEEEMRKGIPFDESKTFKFVPLRPLPNEKHEDENDMEEACYMDGWNDCIKEIVDGND